MLAPVNNKFMRPSVSSASVKAPSSFPTSSTLPTLTAISLAISLILPYGGRLCLQWNIQTQSLISRKPKMVVNMTGSSSSNAEKMTLLLEAKKSASPVSTSILECRTHLMKSWMRWLHQHARWALDFSLINTGVSRRSLKTIASQYLSRLHHTRSSFNELELV